jgi:uncharacterized protein (DUF736 family)
MGYTPRENTGTLFKNDKKTSDKQPDYQGTMLIGGKEMRLAGWMKKSANGTSFMSLQLSEKVAPTTEGAQAKPQPAAPAPTNNGNWDDMPF